MTEIGREEVQKLARDGGQLIEVLPRRQYEEEHIAGAINMPLGRLHEEIHRLRRDRPVIVYCYDQL
ncbi:MAG TPA: rhodanese-like domain-containing protein [Methylomirabilota bacterium]|jgi:rhodanese-related sulfurtransferase|nr:rhodanese-like domain-containing protein [Methylomirabilota bacterium]